MDSATRDSIRQRAGERCEYCRLPQSATPLLGFHIEHIVARQHGGSDSPSNLALACDRCNAYKGPNLTSIDEESGELTPLFNPRTDQWEDHFIIEHGIVTGLTPTGRASVRLLNMNANRRVQLRLLNSS
jgi:hypothetical protein